MKVLVTGGTGFIGSHLARALVARGDEVSILARYRAGGALNRIRDIEDRLAAVIYADIRDGARLKFVGETVEPVVVYHLAAFHHVGRSWEHPEECMAANVCGTANVLEAFPHAKIIYMSSSEVYGRQESVPWREDSTVPAPDSPYAVSKYAGELLCAGWQRRGRAISIVRAFNAYGPGQSEHAVIGELVARAVAGRAIQTTGGRQTRDFVYVDDTVRGLVRAAECDYGGPVNLGTGRETSIRDLVDIVLEQAGSVSSVDRTLADRPNEIWRMAASTGRAEQLLGWRAEIPIIEGIKRTIEWHRNLGARSR